MRVDSKSTLKSDMWKAPLLIYIQIGRDFLDFRHLKMRNMNRTDDTELFMACNYPERTITPKHKYYQQWVLVNGGPRAKGQRLARKNFLNKKYLVLVQNTKRKHSNGKLMADSLQYSVVDSILKVISDEK